MGHHITSRRLILCCLMLLAFTADLPAANGQATKGQARALTLDYLPPHWLVIRGDHLPSQEIRVNYLEAYCRAGSTDADWVKHTVIKHTTELVSLNEDRTKLVLRDAVADGVIVEHFITADAEEVTFDIRAHNPTAIASEIHWAQPCIRLGPFTGFDRMGGDIDDYLPKCFIFIDGQLTRLNQVKPWSKQARYTPGQVWCPADVPRTDVNPRPLSPLVPSSGLIGCFSGDERLIFAVAFEPYQELFQGVIRCLHSDFRLGGLAAGEHKRVRGKMFIVSNDVPALVDRYQRAFPSITTDR